jgi:hypothetical protein
VGNISRANQRKKIADLGEWSNGAYVGVKPCMISWASQIHKSKTLE